MARVIFKMDVPVGYVLGVNGAWGSGKSTLLNFIKTYLAEFNKDERNPSGKIEVIEFRPWMISGHQDLVAAFFKVLSESTKKQECLLKRKMRGVRKMLGSVAKPVMEAAGEVAIAAAGTVGMSGVATSAVGIVKEPIKDRLDAFLKEPSLQEAHGNLVKALKKAGKRYLVVVDDIDRLAQDEVTSMMQMVKTVGQLPNVIYLLSYDRKRVAEAFGDDKVAKNEPRYAEKIIQHEIDLPVPSRTALLTLIAAEIAPMFDSTWVSYTRWRTSILISLSHWVKTPRDVVRLMNGVKFSWFALDGEVDAADIVVMESIRLFDSYAFEWIRDNRTLLLGEDEAPLSTRQQRLNLFFEQFSDETRSGRLEYLLQHIFPTLWRGASLRLSSESEYQIIARRGIGSPAGVMPPFSTVGRSRN